MRFTVEQVILAAPREVRPAAAHRYYVVEAETVDQALDDFLKSHSASLVGTVQKFPGFQAVATARTGEDVFMVSLLPGSDTFRRNAPG